MPQSAPPGQPVRVLLTGGGGFVGGHLAAHLSDLGHSLLAPAIRLPDREGIARLAREFRPDAVIHLAAVSFLPAAERDPAGAIRANVDGTRSVLEGLDDADPGRRVRAIVASSAHVYRSTAGSPLDEESPLGPASVYARTKLAAELLAQVLAEREPPRPLVIFRPFNHTGPGQRPDFAAPSFARQTARIEAGLQEPFLLTGDLSVRRDFSDVRDVVRAYALAAEGKVPPGTYNLASGFSPSLAELAERYRSRSRVPFEIRSRVEPARAGEVREIRGSAEKIRRAAGWRAEIPLERTLDDLLAEWRARASEESGR